MEYMYKTKNGSYIHISNDAAPIFDSHGIYIISPGEFEYANTAFEKIFGYEEKEVCAKKFNFFDLIHPKDWALIAKREEREKGETRYQPCTLSDRLLCEEN